MLKVIVIALLLGAALIHLILPAARPMLVEACRGEHRARFWTRFTGLALLLSVPTGALIGLVDANRSAQAGAGARVDPELWTQISMLRTGWFVGALVIAFLAVGVHVSSPLERGDDSSETAGRPDESES